MLRTLNLVRTYVRLSALNELQYRANFFMELFNSAVQLATGVAGLALVFYHTDTLGDWGPNELLVVMGVYIFISGLIESAIQPNMQRLMEGVRQGTLDYTLTKPEDAQLLVSVTEIQLWKMVDLLLGVGVIVYGMVRLGQQIGWLETGAFLLALLCGGLMVYSLWLILASTSFWFVRVWHILELFHSMVQAGRYPVGIYPTWMRLGLTFLVPIGFAITVPAEALTQPLDPASLGLAVVVAASFVILSRIIWKFAVRHYSGASA